MHCINCLQSISRHSNQSTVIIDLINRALASANVLAILELSSLSGGPILRLLSAD